MLQQELKINREELLQEIASFLSTDLLCYRAPKNHPDTASLHIAQAAAFDPILAWIYGDYAATFLVTESIMPVAQNPAAIAAVKNEFVAATDAQLLALAELTSLLGSALLALAVWKGKINLQEALTASRLDEQHAADRYGLDPVVEARWLNISNKAEKCVFCVMKSK